jgi:hypothetical protein
LDVLQRTLSKKIYQHIRVSPIEAWVTVRERLSGTHIFGTRGIHSEAGGIYDKYALKLAKETQIAGYFSSGHNDPTGAVILNVLIYQIDGDTMALSYPYIADAGGNQLEYYGAAKLATLKSDGRWADLDLPLGPMGQIWTVRAGVSTDLISK